MISFIDQQENEEHLIKALNMNWRYAVYMFYSYFLE